MNQSVEWNVIRVLNVSQFCPENQGCVIFGLTAKETLREFAEDGLRTFVTPVETHTFADVSKPLLRFLLTEEKKVGYVSSLEGISYFSIGFTFSNQKKYEATRLCLASRELTKASFVLNHKRRRHKFPFNPSTYLDLNDSINLGFLLRC